MGIGQRILDLARANLNALMDRASKDDLVGLSEKELEAELERRRQERSAQEHERLRRVAEEAAAKSRGSKREKQAGPPKEPRTRGAARRASEAEIRTARVRVLYKTLGVQHGAPFDEVKKQYRALMREHHPDKHAGDPAKQKAASNRAATITTAYAELEILIGKKR